MSKTTELCLACFNIDTTGKKGKTNHNYGKSCRLKIQKTVMPEKALPINDWYKYVKNENDNNLYKK
jgi:hypothetical protein